MKEEDQYYEIVGMLVGLNDGIELMIQLEGTSG